MLGNGTISEEDMDLFKVLDDPDEVVKHIREIVVV